MASFNLNLPKRLYRVSSPVCREVWTLEYLCKGKGAGEESDAAALRLYSRVEKCLLSMEFKLGSVEDSPVLFPISLVVEKTRLGGMI